MLLFKSRKIINVLEIVLAIPIGLIAFPLLAIIIVVGALVLVPIAGIYGLLRYVVFVRENGKFSLLRIVLGLVILFLGIIYLTSKTTKA